MSDVRDAREVIARASYGFDPVQSFDNTTGLMNGPMPWELVAPAYRSRNWDRADAILADLDAAGYEVVRKMNAPIDKVLDAPFPNVGEANSVAFSITSESVLELATYNTAGYRCGFIRMTVDHLPDLWSVLAQFSPEVTDSALEHRIDMLVTWARLVGSSKYGEGLESERKARKDLKKMIVAIMAAGHTPQTGEEQ